MSQKALLATAAIAVLATQSEAQVYQRACAGLPHICAKFNNQVRAFDEEEWNGEVYGEISSQGGQRDWKVGGRVTFEEEQKIKIGSALKKAANVIVKANELGLLEEDEWNGEVYGEYGRQGGQTNWKVGGRVTFDEEEVEQKFKLSSALKKAANVVIKANELGLLEEDMDEEQKFKLGKALKKVANVVVKANELGLLEEDEDELQIVWVPVLIEVGKDILTGVALDLAVDGVKHAVKWAQNGFKEEEEWGGEMYGEISSQGGQRDWKVGGRVTFEEEQKIKIGSALKKAANVIVKANELGLLEEEQWGGEMYGEYGRQGGQTNWKVGGKITFDEEEAEQKFKLGKALKKAANVVVKAHELGLFEEDMEEEQKIKIGKALKKVANVVVKAHEIGLFEEEEDDLQFLPVVVAVGGEILKDVAVSLAVDAAVGGVKRVVHHYSKHEEDEEQWGGEAYGEISSQGGRRDWKVGGKITFDEEPEQQPKKQSKKWAHGGFKPSFTKPSRHLQFNKNERF